LSVLLFGLFSVLILWGLASAERSGALRFEGWVRRIGLAFGNMSYPLYLIHGIILSPSVPVLLDWLHIPGPVTFVMSLCLAVGCALLLHTLVEQPVMKMLTPVRRPIAIYQ
jgi:peptidoglycan/LPS O-acetylase OafA/YrhL